MDTKVFGIGLSKTGTTSLNNALQALGLNSMHYPEQMIRFQCAGAGLWMLDLLNRIARKLRSDLFGIRRLVYALGRNTFDASLAEQYQALTDLPIGMYFRELDAIYPRSKFILTIRDEDEWIRSARRHFDARTAKQYLHHVNRMRLDVYGCIIFDEQKFRSAYRQHCAEVAEYFRDRPDDLLTLDICAGAGWTEICDFLDIEEPAVRFPHSNKRD